MKKLFLILLLLPILGWNQSFHTEGGTPGSNAIHKDSNVFIAWANDCIVERGFLNISDTTVEINGNNKASHGTAQNAVGIVEGNSADVVSLGDAGVATLTFANPIANGPGYDFAVFENSFSPNFLELAHVEVSSDGINFFRFESTSETSSVVQVNSFGFLDPTYINNLAGKYHQGYGVPFDLQELAGKSGLDISNINYVRIIDAVGSVESQFGSLDVHGNIINDPFPTPFESGGFDLDGVGVIHNQDELSIDQNQFSDFALFPNPCNGNFSIQFTEILSGTLTIYSIDGRIVHQQKISQLQKIQVESIFAPGQYLVRIESKKGASVKQLIIQ